MIPGLGLHDPSTGICRTVDCQFGSAGSHPHQLQGTNSALTSPISKRSFGDYIATCKSTTCGKAAQVFEKSHISEHKEFAKKLVKLMGNIKDSGILWKALAKLETVKSNKRS